MPLVADGGTPAVTLVAQGCGLGYSRGSYGRCRPTVVRLRRAGRPPVRLRRRLWLRPGYGYGRRYGGYGYGRPYGYGY